MKPTKAQFACVNEAFTDFYIAGIRFWRACYANNCPIKSLELRARDAAPSSCFKTRVQLFRIDALSVEPTTKGAPMPRKQGYGYGATAKKAAKGAKPMAKAKPKK